MISMTSWAGCTPESMTLARTRYFSVGMSLTLAASSELPLILCSAEPNNPRLSWVHSLFCSVLCGFTFSPVVSLTFSGLLGLLRVVFLRHPLFFRSILPFRNLYFYSRTTALHYSRNNIIIYLILAHFAAP